MPVDLHVASGQGDYTLHWIDEPRQAFADAVGPDAFVVADQRVWDLYEDKFAGIVHPERLLIVEANEESKTLEGVTRVIDWLQASAADRSNVLVALGGGVVQDVVTFTAHIFMRGIRWVFVPTTLLAMCDSCIGAKCGINHGPFKNQLGVFQSPSAIYLSSRFLETLPQDEVNSGLGEILKLTITESPDAFARLEDWLAGAREIGPDLDDLIDISLRAKLTIIEEDEYEGGLRHNLNYGHTFGHALESVTHHAITHGCAVSWGIDAMNWIAERRGVLDPDLRVRVARASDALLDGVSIPDGVTAETLVAAARRDKKVTGNTVRLVMLEDLGNLVQIPTTFDDTLTDDLASFLAEGNGLRRD